MSTVKSKPDSYRVSILNSQLACGVFITFSGNCREALTFYQRCFGGTLHFDTFDQGLSGYTEIPVISGSLVSDNIIIHGSDLVHNEGRNVGNYLSVFMPCTDAHDRMVLIEKLKSGNTVLAAGYYEEQPLIEVTDDFDVKWVLGVC